MLEWLFDPANVLILVYIYVSVAIIILLFAVYHFYKNKMFYSLLALFTGIIGVMFFTYNMILGTAILIVGIIIQYIIRIRRKCIYCGKPSPTYKKKGLEFCNKECFRLWKETEK